MFNNSHSHQDEYIREYAFEPELLINREDYQRKEERSHKSTSSTASTATTPVRQRWDEVIAKQKEQHRQQSIDIDPPGDDKNQIEIEIEAFYYVSGPRATCPSGYQGIHGHNCGMEPSKHHVTLKLILLKSSSSYPKEFAHLSTLKLALYILKNSRHSCH